MERPGSGTGRATEPGAAAGRTSLGRPLLALLACTPALVAQDVVSGLAGQWALAVSPNPFFLPGNALELYVLAPAIAVSAFVLFLLPGMLLVRAVRDPGNVMALIVLGFGASVLLLIALGTATKLIGGTPLGRTVLLSEWLAVAVFSALAGALRTPSSAAHPESGPQPDARRVAWLVVIAWVGVAVLAPKILWENFNTDGIEAFEFGRSLTDHMLPYWHLHSGFFGFYRDFMLFAWPDHFFITLFGPIEAAVRLPVMLFLAVLFAVLVLIIEHGRRNRLGVKEELTLVLGIGLFTVVQAFNTNTEPFFADLAGAAATDTIWVVCFLAAVWALWTDRTAWFWAFGLMNYAASPGGMFLLLALAAAVITLPGDDRRRKPGAVLGLIAGCVVLAIAYELLYVRLVLQGPSDPFSPLNLVRRLVPPTLTEWPRLNTLVFATGVLPALALLTVRRRDALAWSLATVTVLYFGAAYAQTWASVHQFTPAMVLPIAVFWRGYLDGRDHRRAVLLPLSLTLTVFCATLSLPRHNRINVAVRAAGLATEYRVADYDTAYIDAANASRSVFWLFPEDYRLEYPEQPWGTDRYSWLYYATRPKPEGAAIAYVIQDPALRAPPGAELAGRDSSVAAYVVDEGIWQQQRDPGVPRVVTSPLYEPILRSMSRFFRNDSMRVQQNAGDPGLH